ncbi:MAG TPA: PDZ domain-containing protein [Polyangiaceae bacterium]|nr:PDZ domain-containing protein [Polyangiaceae bacterium]
MAARRLGVGAFRWFDGRRMGGAWWQRLAVRGLSCLATLLAVLLLIFIGNLVQGSTTPTTTVEVRPGPAESAGIRTGDRILSVDGKAIESWEALRTELQRGFGPRRIEIARKTQKMVVSVTPRDGRINVSPVYESRELTAREALGRALRSPGAILTPVLERAFREHEDRTTLVGPVAIVQESKKQNDGSFLLFLGILGCNLWPLVAGVHAFDALTLLLFRATHPWAHESTEERSTARLARVQQALLVSLFAVSALVFLEVVQETSFGDGALLGIMLLAPAAFAHYLLVTIAALERWGKGFAMAAVAVSLIVPCAALGLPIWLLHWLRGELARRGFRVSWFVTSPKSSR